MTQSDVKVVGSREAPFNQLPTEAAYEATLPEMLALVEADLAQINVDVVSAVTMVLGSLPEIRALRDEVVTELPGFDVKRLDKLEQYALALQHAHALHRIAQTTPAGLAALAAELGPVRDRMLSLALALAEFGLLDRGQLKDCKTSIGYRPLATDVLTLVALFKQHWSALSQKTPVTAELLEEAGSRALDLLAGVGEKEQAPVTASEAASRKLRAFSLFVRAYDDARRAVAYLRPKGDAAEEIAPSLYTKRPNRPRSEEGAEESGAAGATTGAVSGSNTASAAAKDDVAPDIVVDNRAGLPITHPFTN